MRAVRIDGQTPGGKRNKLKDALPLDTPYMVQFFPIYACNFKCGYCIHSVPVSQRRYITDKTAMDFNLYKKCIDGLSKFPNKVKMIRFAGTGEPLLHKDIAKMVEYAVKMNVAEAVDIVTNGLLLEPDLSDKLIAAGLSKLRVSIQGVTSGKYEEIYGKKVGISKIVDNLSYFYNAKQKSENTTQLYIKIIDCALEEGDEEKFLNMFGDICDIIAIEHLLPAVPQIEYKDKFNMDSDNLLTQNGNRILEAQVCPQPFYMMQINPEGNIVPCCAMETAKVIGNVNDNDLYSLWVGEEFNKFRRNLLSLNKQIYPVCKSCESYKYSMFEEDFLDDARLKLLDLYVSR